MSPTYKLVKDNGYHRTEDVLFESDDLLEVGRYARDKGGGGEVPLLDASITLDGEKLL